MTTGGRGLPDTKDALIRREVRKARRARDPVVEALEHVFALDEPAAEPTRLMITSRPVPSTRPQEPTYIRALPGPETPPQAPTFITPVAVESPKVEPPREIRPITEEYPYEEHDEVVPVVDRATGKQHQMKVTLRKTYPHPRRP
jgi:hypothetical protein